MSNHNLKDTEHGFFRIAFSRDVMPRAIRVALIVGTILALINHGDKMMLEAFSRADIYKVILTYFVPYSVSSWSSVRALQERMADSEV
ncbi:MAG: nitrate/nitrite transporter NrtS [Gammaproteobacteria bacterium]|nr:nitrate/nitrite transporter NrtS [Gammaproteobacteria bacterium]